MEFNRTTIRTLSILGQRGAFGTTLTELSKEDKRLIALTADLCNTSGLDRFYNEYPERIVNVGIAEQNMIGVAAGISTLDFIPFATTFSNFAALRSCEQLRHYMGYMKENIKIVGFGGGFAMGMFGITHYGIEDIAAIRAIPNITIISPADCMEVAKATIAAVTYNGPVYIRLTGGMNHPVLYKEDYNYKIGEAIKIKEGKDVAIYATGGMVYQALKATSLLEEKGVSCKLFNIHTIKPLDLEAVYEAADTKLIVTIEEHSCLGGLGSAIAEALSDVTMKPPQLMIGISQEYKAAGSYEFMLDEYGLTFEQIEVRILEKYSEVR